jgi:glycosyltransferase involved in cell wall biosynthesis
MRDNVKVGIITVVLNAEKTVQKTIKSVKNQNYKNVIHLIIDGGSKDNTKAIIFLNEHEKLDLEIQPGLGIYESMNHGINLLMNKVDLIGFLNADDFLNNDNTVFDIVKRCNTSDVVMSAVNIVDKKNLQHSLRIFNPVKNKFLHSICILSPHPGFYVSTSILKRLPNPYYDPKSGQGADIVWMRNILKKAQKIEILDIISVCMRDGGVSNKDTFNKMSHHIKLYKYVYGYLWFILLPFIFILKQNRTMLQKRRAHKFNLKKLNL